jgi:hypothetical protein
MLRNGFNVDRSPTGRDGVIIPQYELDRTRIDAPKSYGLTADFAYIDTSKNILVDIEVDGGVHGIGENIIKDHGRNLTFAGRGWAVIRFMDTETVTKSDECVEEIATLIRTLETGTLEQKSERYFVFYDYGNVLSLVPASKCYPVGIE